jgi:hypothetical protein
MRLNQRRVVNPPSYGRPSHGPPIEIEPHRLILWGKWLVCIFVFLAIVAVAILAASDASNREHGRE